MKQLFHSGHLKNTNRRTSKPLKPLSDGKYSTLLVLPALVVLLFFGIFPLIYAINLSLRDVNMTSGSQEWAFVGFRNFRYALQNEVFGSSLARTALFAATSVSMQMLLGIWLAFMLNKLKWFKGIIRALFIMPMASAPAAIGMIWRYMYDSEFGIFNAALRWIGLQPVNWLGNSKIAFWSIVAFDVWQWTPFVMLITLAALQSLPKEPFEAAELDGGSKLRVLTKLTFPMIGSVLGLVFLWRFIDSARLYDPIQTTTRGGPGQATETVTFFLYRVGLKQFRMDYASAMSLIVMFIIIIVTSFVLRSMLKKQGERSRSE